MPLSKPREVVIVSAARTPDRRLPGRAGPARRRPKLGAIAIKAALERRGRRPRSSRRGLHGLRAAGRRGPGARASGGDLRRAARHVPCTTVNKVCGSGLKAVIAGRPGHRAGRRRRRRGGRHGEHVQRPYYDYATRGGRAHGQRRARRRHDPRRPVGRLRPGAHGRLRREVRHQPRTSPRGAQDEFARMSTERAQKAQKDGRFKAEIVPRRGAAEEGRPRQGDAKTRGPRTPSRTRLPQLKPVFQKDGTVTAANASSINDGAAARGPHDAPSGPQAEKRTVLGTIRGYGSARPQARGVHHRAGGRHAEALRGARAQGPRTSISARSTRPSRWWRSPTTSCSGSTART